MSLGERLILYQVYVKFRKIFPLISLNMIDTNEAEFQ